jgi:hypothetical protein
MYIYIRIRACQGTELRGDYLSVRHRPAWLRFGWLARYQGLTRLGCLDCYCCRSSPLARIRSCARNGRSSLLGAAVALDLTAPARLGAAVALEMAARARLGAAVVLEMAARACLRAAVVPEMVTRACLGAAAVLEMPPRSRLFQDPGPR